jgi:tetratricopeptide (TPR) repeat protein
VLALLEDAHWIDHSSLDLFGRLIARVVRMGALLVATFRPDFTAPWLGPGHVHALALSRLGRRHAHALIKRVAVGKSLPAEVLDEIVAKTDGVPLFMEELTKTVLESGLLREEGGAYVLASALTPLAIPSTLQDSLMARLDRLAPIKEVAQLGAAIGREFTYGLLEAVSPIHGEPLRDALARLMAAGLVFGHGTPPDATYTFKHALVQDTAYATLLKSRKQRLHQQIAEALRDLFPERAEREPSVVAQHFTRAGLDTAAIDWWERAGQRALSRFANREAIESYLSGLGLIANLPLGEPRDRRELLFRLALGPALLADRGYASDEVERNSVAASRLAEGLHDAEAAFTSARGLWHYHYDRAELDRALRLAERLDALASDERGAEKKSLALRAIGSTLMNKGEFARAVEVFERCIAESAAASLGGSLARHGEEPRIVALQYKGLSLTVQGFPDAGLAAAMEALSLARRLNYPLMETFAANILANVQIMRRDYASCISLAAEQIEFCARHRLAFWSAAHEILHGAALACGGEAAGLAKAEAGIRAWRQTGAGLHVPTWSAYLADGALCVGDLDVAEQALADGAEACSKHGENFALAELRRLTGLLMQRSDRPAEARQALEEAVRIARQQAAGLFLLRAGRDLARFLAEDGDTISAVQVLAPIIDKGSEFRNGTDFQEASRLHSVLLN